MIFGTRWSKRLYKQLNICQEKKYFGSRDKKLWRQNEIHQSKVRVKKNILKNDLGVKKAEIKKKYKKARKETKKMVNEARTQIFERLYQFLRTKEKEKSIYMFVMKIERKIRDLD